jgi:hypothetical protein
LFWARYYSRGNIKNLKKLELFQNVIFLNEFSCIFLWRFVMKKKLLAVLVGLTLTSVILPSAVFAQASTGGRQPRQEKEEEEEKKPRRPEPERRSPRQDQPSRSDGRNRR